MRISKPTLIINTSILRNNISDMLGKIDNINAFRPHFKTHQSIETGNIFKSFGVSKITVSSVSMAKYFSSEWNDITIAFPVNLFELDDINEIAEVTKLNLLIESLDTARYLEQRLLKPTDVYIKIDTGYNRTGLHPHSKDIDSVIKYANQTDKLIFKGFLTHAGNTYTSKGQKEIDDILNNNYLILGELKRRYIKDYPGLIISYGDTPSCSLANNLNMFDEIRPGNFAYYDIMQYHIGSCRLEDIAVAVACQVVAIHPERNEIVIYGGAVHLSKESIDGDNGFQLFGYIVEFSPEITYDSGNINKESLIWYKPVVGTYLSNLSQEHGIIKASDDFIKRTKPGDLIGILPVHACLAADLLHKSQIMI